MSADEDAEIARERDYLLGKLRDTVTERADLDQRERDWAHGARHAGIGWDDIGQALGISGDQARDRHGEPPAGTEPF